MNIKSLWVEMTREREEFAGWSGFGQDSNVYESCMKSLLVRLSSDVVCQSLTSFDRGQFGLLLARLWPGNQHYIVNR